MIGMEVGMVGGRNYDICIIILYCIDIRIVRVDANNFPYFFTTLFWLDWPKLYGIQGALRKMIYINTDAANSAMLDRLLNGGTIIIELVFRVQG